MSERKGIFFCLVFFLSLSCISILHGQRQIQRVDFLSRGGLTVNGAGPLLVRTDAARHRVVLVNTNTSSISLISTRDYKATNIPVKSRVPQYVKDEALAIDNRGGNIYVIGNKCLHIVEPGKGTAQTIGTAEQYDVVAVNETNGAAFLVGRESFFLAIIKPGSQKIKRIRWVDRAEPMKNLNQTPPPPIRKVVYDNRLHKIITLDGYTGTIHVFSPESGKLLKKRKLDTAGGSRWHMAGFNQKNHCLYVVAETDQREVVEALKIDTLNKADTVVKLPGLKEGVGINYNALRDEVYIPYDNDPTVHVVDFKKGGSLSVIQVPTSGNDASAVDEAGHTLYTSSWGYGEIDVIDLKTRKLKNRIPAGILPHMFSMDFNPHDGRLFIPIGATAVNGSFGAAVTALHPGTGEFKHITTGWAPVALVELDDKEEFLVFNSENEYARVTPGGAVTYHTLPCRFINNAVKSPGGRVYVSYGPHQSYWPAVYIWAAKNGILKFDPSQPWFDDCRIPRMAHQMVFGQDNALYALQNNWGGEKQFLVSLPDGVRCPNLPRMRLELNDKVTRETTQRLLRYDREFKRLYIARTGETDSDPGILQVFDTVKKATLLTYPTGLTPTDLVFDDTHAYIADFDSDTVTAISRSDFTARKLKTEAKPFRLAVLGEHLYCLNHKGNSLQVFLKGEGEPQTYKLPVSGRPSQMFAGDGELIITTHSPEALYILSFNPAAKSFETLHKELYPFAETTVDTENCAFYVRGQFADGIFQLNQIKRDKKGRTWITDYLSGKLFIISK